MGETFCERPFALHRQQPEKDKQKFDVAPLEKFLQTPMDQWRTQKIFMGVFIQWYMVVICIWCALFVTSQFDVIFMFASEVC